MTVFLLTEELLDEFSLDSKKKKKKKAKKVRGFEANHNARTLARPRALMPRPRISISPTQVADLDDNLEEPSTPAEAEEDDKDYTYKEV